MLLLSFNNVKVALKWLGFEDKECLKLIKKKIVELHIKIFHISSFIFKIVLKGLYHCLMDRNVDVLNRYSCHVICFISLNHKGKSILFKE